MRSVSTNFQSSARKIGARLWAKNYQMSWSAVTYSEVVNSVATSFHEMTTKENAGGYVERWAIKKTTNELYYNTFTPQSFTNGMTTPWAKQSALIPNDPMTGQPNTDQYFQSLAHDGFNTLLCASRGIVYRLDNNVAWTQIYDFTDPDTFTVPYITLAPTGITGNFAVACAYVDSNGGINDRIDVYILNSVGGYDKWPGYIPKASGKTNIASVYDNGIYYFYVNDGSNKKPVCIKRFAYLCWGSAEPILPLDAFDEDSSLSVSSAGKTNNGYPYLMGVYQRSAGPSYTIVMRGPDKFTFGRNLIILPNDTSKYKELYYVSNVNGQPNMYALALGKFAKAVQMMGPFCSPAADAAQYGSNATVPYDYFIDVPAFQMQYNINAPDRLSFQMHPSMITGKQLQPGTDLYVEAKSNGVGTILGRFGVDRIAKEESDKGDYYTVDCTSWALKKMIDWESDTYFDYLAQGFTAGDPIDLTKMIRVSGKWDKPQNPENHPNGASLTRYNEDGMMYTVPAAADGGWISCQFDRLYYGWSSPDQVIGVGLNYGTETLADAAKRLGKKMEDLKSEDRMTYGIFAVYFPWWQGYPDTNPRTGMLCLYSYNTTRQGGEDPGFTGKHPWLLLSSTPYVLTSNKLWIGLSYQDGYARIYTAESAGRPTYTLKLAKAVKFEDVQQTETVNYGRGVIYMKLDTGFEGGYPFPADGDIAPFHLANERDNYYGIGIQGDPRWKYQYNGGGEIMVDEEIMKAAGIAGLDYDPQAFYATERGTMQDLMVLPGKVCARSVTDWTAPDGGEVVFAKDRTNNYLVQEFTVPAACTLVSIRLWLRKVKFPEDGVEVMIWTGQTAGGGNDPTPLGSVVTGGAYISSSTLKDAGGWVMAYFPDPPALNANQVYRILIRRSKNATHPYDTGTCYATKTRTAQGGFTGKLYTFQEDNDIWHLQTGVLPFQAFAKLSGINQEFMVALPGDVDYTMPAAYPTTDQNYYNNMGFCVTQGGGKGLALRIARSFRLKDTLNDIYVFCLEKDPGRVWDENSMARICAAYYGLTRAQRGTTAVSHGLWAKVQRYDPNVQILHAEKFEYFDANEDKTLAEVARDIARKAEVPEITLANRHPGTLTWAGDVWTAASVNNIGSQNQIIILNTDTALQANQRLQVSWFNSTGNRIIDLQLLKQSSDNKCYVVVSSIADGTTTPLVTDINKMLDQEIAGDIRISLSEHHLSVWIGSRLVAATMLQNTGLDTFHAWTYVLARAYDGNTPVRTTPNVKCYIYEAGTRVESFVMDMGKTGTQLLTSLIGEKRVFFREDPWGALKIFTERPVVSTPIYDRALNVKSSTSDEGLATRVLLEGGEVVEVSSAGNLATYGNLFKTFNFNEINDKDDATYFANIVLADMQLNLKPIEFSGPADPTYEPGDKIKAKSRGNVTRYLVVDNITMDMHTDDAEAIFDMRVQGRETGAF